MPLQYLTLTLDIGDDDYLEAENKIYELDFDGDEPLFGVNEGQHFVQIETDTRDTDGFVARITKRLRKIGYAVLDVDKDE